MDRRSSTRERAPRPENPLPFSSGNTPEKVAGAPEVRPTPPAPEAPTAPPGPPAATPPPDVASKVSPNATMVPVPEAHSRLAPACGSRCAISSATCRTTTTTTSAAGRPNRIPTSSSIQGRGVRAVAPPLRRAGQAQLERAAGGLDAAGTRRHSVLRPQGRHDSRHSRRAAGPDRRLHDGGVQRAEDVESGRRAPAGISRPIASFFTVTFHYNDGDR